MAPSVLVPSISLARRQNDLIILSPGACHARTTQHELLSVRTSAAAGRPPHSSRAAQAPTHLRHRRQIAHRCPATPRQQPNCSARRTLHALNSHRDSSTSCSARPQPAATQKALLAPRARQRLPTEPPSTVHRPAGGLRGSGRGFAAAVSIAMYSYYHS